MKLSDEAYELYRTIWIERLARSTRSLPAKPEQSPVVKTSDPANTAA